MSSEAEPRARIVPTSQEGAIPREVWEEGPRGNPGIGPPDNLQIVQPDNLRIVQQDNLRADPVGPGQALNHCSIPAGVGRRERPTHRLGSLRLRHRRLRAHSAEAAVRRLPASGALQADLNPPPRGVQRLLAAQVAAVGAAGEVDVVVVVDAAAADVANHR